MNTLQAFLIIYRRLTEYLPVSSTAHMVLSSYFGIQEDDFVKLFQVSIHLELYWRLLHCIGRNFSILYKNVAITLHQTDLCCHSCSRFRKLFDDKIEAVLGNPIPIAIVLILGNCFVIY
jgi:undecaprenyl-diphosphatase